METRLCAMLVGILTLSSIAVAVTACGGAKKEPAGTAVVTTLAGQAGSRGHTDGTGTTARFNGPTGIACDAVGNLYVADTLNSTIRKITPAGVVTTLAGNAKFADWFLFADGRGAAARFYHPAGIACDAVGNLYVADTQNNLIRKVTPAGQVSTLTGQTAFPGHRGGSLTSVLFATPIGIACDAAGNLYVTGSSIGVRKITPAGKVTTLAGAAASTGVAVPLGWPHGITLDNAGNLYLADSVNDTIDKFTPAGVVTILAGKSGTFGHSDGIGAAARFDTPTGVARDAAGNLYIADSGNNSIRKITPAGVVTTLAGSLPPGSVDGDGVAARFETPTGITIDAAGNLYVTDCVNCTIRKFTLSH